MLGSGAWTKTNVLAEVELTEIRCQEIQKKGKQLFQIVMEVSLSNLSPNNVRV